MDYVCTVRMVSHQILQDDPKLLVKQTSKDPALTKVMCCVKEGDQTNIQTNSRTTRNYTTLYPLNMVAYSMDRGL